MFLKCQDGPGRPEGSHLLQAVQKEEARLLLRLRTKENLLKTIEVLDFNGIFMGF